MAKRRAEDTLLHNSPSKRCFRSLCAVDIQAESMAPSGGVSPPSLLALLGTRCRKRPQYFDEEETASYRKTSHYDARKRAVNVSAVQTSGSFQDRRSSSVTSSQKRPREGSEEPDTGTDWSAGNKMLPRSCVWTLHFYLSVPFQADEDANTEDCTYNSFQYWRVPLPELDLSLLEDASDHSKTKDKSKASSSDAMET
uniref:Putative WW-binding domain-containing protein n=1 Tax=Haplochromis burtoni TaxID=8153 RepID=A0A3Q2VEF7_HAPBU